MGVRPPDPARRGVRRRPAGRGRRPDRGRPDVPGRSDLRPARRGDHADRPRPRLARRSPTATRCRWWHVTPGVDRRTCRRRGRSRRTCRRCCRPTTSACASPQGLDPVLAPVLSTIDNLDAYVDPWLTPPDFLDWLAGWFGARARRDVARGAAAGARRQRPRARPLAGHGDRAGAARRAVHGRARPRSTTAAAVVASDDPDEPLPGRPTQAVTVRYQPGRDVDADRLARLVRDAVPAHLAVRCEADGPRR